MHRREKIEREAIEEHTSRPQDQHHVADRPRLPRYSGSHSELLCDFGGRLAEELKVVPAASHVKRRGGGFLFFWFSLVFSGFLLVFFWFSFVFSGFSFVFSGFSFVFFGFSYSFKPKKTKEN